MAITSYGTLSVWNTATKKAMFPSLPVASLLSASATDSTPHPTITTSSLLPNGTPLLALSSGSTHTFDMDLCAWAIVCDTWWSRGSDFWEGRRGGRGNQSGRGVVRTIESAINEIVVDAKAREEEDGGQESADEDEEAANDDGPEQPAGPGPQSGSISAPEQKDKDGDADVVLVEDAVAAANTESAIKKMRLKGKGWEYVVEQARPKKRRRTVPKGDRAPESELADGDVRRVAISLAHLETRIAAAFALDSPAEYKTFLLMYARKLSDEALRSKAEELVRELLGPVY